LVLGILKKRRKHIERRGKREKRRETIGFLFIKSQQNGRERDEQTIGFYERKEAQKKKDTTGEKKGKHRDQGPAEIPLDPSELERRRSRRGLTS